MRRSERHLRHLDVILLGLGAIALSGCATLDPWRQMSRAPASPSSAYVGPGAPADEAETASSLLDELKHDSLTLAQCIWLALKRNPRTAGSWQTARAAAARAGQTRSAYFPAVGFVSGASRGDQAELDGKADTGPQNTFDALFGVRWLLFDGGGRDARARGADADLLAANFRHNTVLQDVALAVAEGYYDLLAAQRFRDLAVETVRQREYHVRIADARHKAGLVARSDVLRAETEKADADLALVQAENAVRLARGRLASAMGLRVSEPLEVADIPEDAHRQELEDVEALLDEAARSRPELQAALAQVEAQRAGVKEAEARFWPAVSLGADAGWAGRTFFPGQGQWGLGLDLDAALFTGFDRTYQSHRAKADLARAVADRRNVLGGVELEVWTAYWQTIESSQAIEAASRFVASAEESARVAEGEYKNGTGSILGLIDAQTARTAARTRLIRARLDWHTAMARFERAVGRTIAASEVIAKEKVKP